MNTGNLQLLKCKSMENTEKCPYIVQFCRWRDPFKQLVEKNKRQREEHIDEFGEDSTSIDFQDLDQYTGVILETDHGVMPLTESNCLSTQFKFYRGDTNFPLEQKHRLVLDTLLGIEALEIYTPYRFRIAVGKLFNDKDVLERAKNALIKTMNRSPKNPRKRINPEKAKQIEIDK